MVASIPHTKFSTKSFASRERRAAWIEGMKHIHDAAPLDRESLDFKGEVEVRAVGGLGFANIEFDAQIMDYRPTNHHRSGQEEHLFVSMYQSGHSWVLQGDKPLVNSANTIAIVDCSRNRRSVSSAAKLRGISVPYKAVGYEPSKRSGGMVLSNDVSAGYLLNRLAAMIFEKLPAADVKDGEIMAGMFTGMMRSLIGGDGDEAAREQAVMSRRAVMRQFVIDNIHDLNLNVATLCEKFGVSRATVFRNFEPGGLQNFIMIHRLNQALSDIAFGPAIRGRIAMIAEKWGFSSPAHFSRIFKESFGFSPSDASGVGKGAANASIGVTGIDDGWMIWRKR